MLGGRLGATTHDRLLPRHAPRSDDTGSTHDPEAGDPASSPPHRLTGAFADPAPETSFGASCFRAAYPVHMALMTLWLISDAWFMRIDSDAVQSLYVAADAALLLGRVALHRRDDHVAAQSVGGIVWTCVMTGTVLSVCISILITEKRDDWCVAPDDVGGTLAMLVLTFAFAYLNSSHGLRFWHKTALWAGLFALGVYALGIYGEACDAPAVCELVLGHGLCHMLELHARHAFYVAEELRETRERLAAWQTQTISDVAKADRDGPAVQTAGGGSDASSSGPFALRAHSLWSGWSAAWSDPDLTYQEKLSRAMGWDVAGFGFRSLREAVRKAKAYLADVEAAKAKRRAAEHGKSHGRLVWKILRRAQRDPASPLCCVPRDALRIIVHEFIRGEVARLEVLYSERLAAGATSYRG